MNEYSSFSIFSAFVVILFYFNDPGFNFHLQMKRMFSSQRSESRERFLHDQALVKSVVQNVSKTQPQPDAPSTPLHSCYLPPSTICPQPGYPSPYPIPVTSCLLTQQRPPHYPILATLSLLGHSQWPTLFHCPTQTTLNQSLPWGRLVLSHLEISRVLRQSRIHCPGIKSKLSSVIWFPFLTSSYLYWNFLESLFR